MYIAHHGYIYPCVQLTEMNYMRQISLCLNPLSTLIILSAHNPLILPPLPCQFHGLQQPPPLLKINHIPIPAQCPSPMIKESRSTITPIPQLIKHIKEVCEYEIEENRKRGEVAGVGLAGGRRCGSRVLDLEGGCYVPIIGTVLVYE